MARDQVFSIEDDETADGLLVGILLLLESASVGTRLGREVLEGIVVGLEEGVSLGVNVGTADAALGKFAIIVGSVEGSAVVVGASVG
jgi:hypothetical protein